MRSHLAFLPFSCLAFWKSKYFVKGKEVFKNLIFLIFFILTCSSILSHFLLSEEKVQYLKKVGEIKEGFSSEKENFFIKISSLCCDDEGNLYVADSGWNKIFKFDFSGKFLMSFGRQGQGPGEFMAHPMRAHIKISFGNDGKLYVNDPGNGRLSIFSKEGKFIKSFRLPPYTYDTPVVNSKGDIYLLSPSGIKLIDIFDSSFKYKNSLLDTDSLSEFPYLKAPLNILRRMRIRPYTPLSECFNCTVSISLSMVSSIPIIKMCKTSGAGVRCILLYPRRLRCSYILWTIL